MALSLEEMLAKRPANRELVKTRKRAMLAETRAYRLGGPREQSDTPRPTSFAHPDTTI